MVSIDTASVYSIAKAHNNKILKKIICSCKITICCLSETLYFECCILNVYKIGNVLLISSVVHMTKILDKPDDFFAAL